MAKRSTLALFAVPLLLGGCISFETAAPVDVATTSSFKVPWQVAPATALTAKVHRDEPQIFEAPGWGRIKATRRVLASYPHELQSKPGRNRTAEACREQLQRGAGAYGLATVSIASLGPERRQRHGLFEGNIEVRIVYAGKEIPEVRQATMACQTRADGTFVAIKPLFPIDDETTG